MQTVKMSKLSIKPSVAALGSPMRNSVKLMMAAAGAAALALSASHALAKPYHWTFTDTGGTVLGSGWLTTSTADNGGFDVSSFYGTVSGTYGGGVSLIPEPAPNGGTGIVLHQTGYAKDPNNFKAYDIVDNILYPNRNPALDQYGIAFLADGQNWNVFANGAPGQDEMADSVGNGFPDDHLGTFAVSPAPEPVTWAMLILGLASTGWALRRRSQGVSAVA